jgi:glucan phosphoethanolaminetransferase (alkaline phosphatase superfamily)
VSSVARSIHLVVVWLFVACCIVQVFLAGLGVFDTPTQFEVHRNFGYTFGLLVFVILVAAILGGLGRRQIALAALLVVLFIMQSVFVAFRESAPAIAALHPVNGFLITGVAIVSGWMAWTARRAPGTT